MFCIRLALPLQAMKKLLAVISVLMVLGAVVPGCRQAVRYDGRLTAADSLMKGAADSALALLEGLSPGDLHTGRDSAYRDLLLTQARYRAYITATSDSDINRALAWFRAHPADREKLTRAYIYKGAVMDELGHPDSAMLYYKHAEATAAPDDYFNLGYAKMRIGSLLRDYYAYDGKEIVYFEEALDLFNRLESSDYQYICMNNLGCLLRETNPHRADSLLNCALLISREKNDTNCIIDNLHALIVLYDKQEKSDKALDLLNDMMSLGKVASSFSFCTTAANVYAHNGLVDSAKVFLNLATQFNNLDNPKNRMYLYDSKAALALACGDTLGFLMYNTQEKHISDSLIVNSPKPIIIKEESNFEKQLKKRLKEGHLKRMAILFLTALFCCGVMMWIIYKKRTRKYDRIINQLKMESNDQLSVLDNLQNSFDQLAITDSQIKQFISIQIDMLRSITVACYHEPRNKLSEELKKIIEFQEENKSKWSQLYCYIDVEKDGIMSFVQRNYPVLNEKELLLVALSCLKFSYIQIAIIMGYPNPTSVGTMKQRVAQKMGLRGSLNDFIAEWPGQNYQR